MSARDSSPHASCKRVLIWTSQPICIESDPRATIGLKRRCTARSFLGHGPATAPVAQPNGNAAHLSQNVPFPRAGTRDTGQRPVTTCSASGLSFVVTGFSGQAPPALSPAPSGWRPPASSVDSPQRTQSAPRKRPNLFSAFSASSAVNSKTARLRSRSKTGCNRGRARGTSPGCRSGPGSLQSSAAACRKFPRLPADFRSWISRFGFRNAQSAIPNGADGQQAERPQRHCPFCSRCDQSD